MLPYFELWMYVSRGMDTAVAFDPSSGMRTTMMVSVFTSPSATPALRRRSSSSDSGLPCASVRESEPTRRMSIAPSREVSLFLPFDLLCVFTLSSEALSWLPRRPTVK